MEKGESMNVVKLDVAQYAEMMILKCRILSQYSTFQKSGFNPEESMALIEGTLQGPLAFLVPISKVWCNQSEGKMNNKQQQGEVLTHVPQMSLRDYMACHAMSGILAYPGNIGGMDSIEASAIISYKYADAMLEARKK